MSRKTILANLHRFVRLNDKSDTQVFTFIVPTQLTRGFVNEVYSENFLFRNQTWVVKFDRKERHIGAYLIMRSMQNQLSCIIDYSFMVLNRDHFTKNESFSERSCEFSLKKLCRGRPSFIEVADLENRHFLFDDGKFLIELELKNCATIYDDDLSLAQLDEANDTIESNYFTFGGCDWSILLRMPMLKSGEAANTPEFSLVRHSHFEHYCKISYRITVKGSDWPEMSASVEQQLDIKGYGSYFRLRSEKPLTVNAKQTLHVSLRLYSMRQLSIIDLLPTNRQRNASRCYDLNQHDWMVQSDILGSVVKLRFFYMQVANVPKNQAHLVCWDTQILPHNPKLDIVKTVSGPYCVYYSQKESDEGIEVATNLIVEQVGIYILMAYPDTE